VVTSRRVSGSVFDAGDGKKVRVQVSAGHDPVTHKRRRPSRTISGGVREIEKALDALQIAAGKVPEAHGLRLSAYFEDMWFPWLETRVPQGKIRRETIDGYRSKYDLHIEPFLGTLMLDKLTPYTLERWLGDLAAGGRSKAMLDHCYRVLHNALGRAVKWRMLVGNPLDGVEAPDVPAYQPHVRGAGEANAIIDAFTGHQLEPIVLLALGGALRVSELAAVDWSDFDWTTGSVRIWRGYHSKNGKAWFEENKTERSKRTVALPGWAIGRLKELRSFGPLVADNGVRLVPSRITSRYKARFAAVDKGVPKAAQMPWTPLKDLRHTSATIALSLGVDVVVVSRRLGHSQVGTTDRYYLRPGATADADAATKMDGMRGSKKAPKRGAKRA
jgi:integrase